MPKTLAAALPEYLPTLPFFKKMQIADVFLLADDVMFSRQSPVQRCRIRTADGELWLSVPVLQKQRGRQNIGDVIIDETRNWRQKHWRNLRHSYQFSAYFDFFADEFSAMYDDCWQHLLEVNIASIETLCKCLQLRPEMVRASAIAIPETGSASERIAELTIACGCDVYLASPGDRRFLDETAFKKRGIQLQYLQDSGSGENWYSAVDALFQKGPVALR
ncbi:MAG: WbqC family protein [Calditrichaeota bacterium]|nr:WbqC family protein [Calditrichota bacterium]MCB0299946.1 WbqC family protein [Calditrichota bacterium]